MRMMSVGLIIFLFAIGIATFLESIYDIQTAKLLIYNAIWFELLLIYLTINLIINTFRHNMWQRAKIAILLFHLSFIVIMIGAGVTRHVSFEGVMKLPEPDPQTGILRPVDHIYSADPRLKIYIENKYVEETMFMSKLVKPRFNVNFKFPEKNKTINVKIIDFQPKHIDSLVVNDTISNYVLNIVTGGNTPNYLSEGDFMMVGNIPLSFEKKDLMPGGIELYNKDGKMMLKTSLPMRYLPMAQMQQVRQSGMDVPDSMFVNIPVDTLVPFNVLTLYYVGEQSFVFKEKVNHAKKMLVPSGRKDLGDDYLTLQITDGNDTKIVKIAGGHGIIANEERFTFNGMLYSIQYGGVPIRLPFSLACNDFTLHKYPGSTAPSSYESIVTINDNKHNFKKTQKIFMNNVMDYRGYRFFQSSYFPDETGTILSVNYDWWGTNITYLGYLLMMVGMFASIFAPASRFQELNGKLKKIKNKRMKAGLLILLLMVNSISFAQDQDYHVHEDGSVHYGNHDEPVATSETAEHEHTHEAATTSENEPYKAAAARYISIAHAKKLEHLMVQDYQGRIVPFHTLSEQLLTKISRKNTYTDGDHTYNAVQTVLSMHMQPDAWLDKKVIFVSKVLREKLKMKDAYASFVDLIDKDRNEFILADEYQKAHQKAEKERGEFDKQLIKLVDRFQIFSEIQFWQYMRIMPVRIDAQNTWFTPFAEEVSKNEPEMYKLGINYFQSVNQASIDNNYDVPNAELDKLIASQRSHAGDIAPSSTKINAEIIYNKLEVFKHTMYAYLLLGLGLVVIFLIAILSSKGERKGVKITRNVLTGALILFFIFHLAGMLIRWFITGYAPWSNGYEALAFIAWIAILAGLMFNKKNQVILGAAAILAFFMLFVTELNILDPEISPLVPVLKSYWLQIHVSIITASYAFLGLGAILGFINMILYVFKTKENNQLFTWNINELTYVSEMSMTIGIYLLTAGTFLGGVWANESWGRYWGWDPKETWALVSILAYAVLLHLRFIPSLKGKFLFNAASLWAYTSILFTFFGVNFYLVGLHSYAQGDGLGEFPMGIIVATVIFYMFTEFAALKSKRFHTEASNLNLAYFLRKIMYTSVVFALIFVAFALLYVIEWNEALKASAQTIAVIAFTNLALFVYQKVKPNEPVQLMD